MKVQSIVRVTSVLEIKIIVWQNNLKFHTKIYRDSVKKNLSRTAKNGLHLLHYITIMRPIQSACMAHKVIIKCAKFIQ